MATWRATIWTFDGGVVTDAEAAIIVEQCGWEPIEHRPRRVVTVIDPNASPFGPVQDRDVRVIAAEVEIAVSDEDADEIERTWDEDGAHEIVVDHAGRHFVVSVEDE